MGVSAEIRHSGFVQFRCLIIIFTAPAEHDDAARLLPQAKGNRHGIDAEFGPPCGFVAAAVNFAVMNAAQRHGELVAHLSAECARLGKAYVVRLAWLPPAHRARLPGDEAQVFLVAKAAQFAGVSFDLLTQRCRGSRWYGALLWSIRLWRRGEPSGGPVLLAASAVASSLARRPRRTKRRPLRRPASDPDMLLRQHRRLRLQAGFGHQPRLAQAMAVSGREVERLLRGRACRGAQRRGRFKRFPIAIEALDPKAAFRVLERADRARKIMLPKRSYARDRRRLPPKCEMNRIFVLTRRDERLW